MLLETLLTAALDKAADLLIAAGLSGAKDLQDQLLHTDEKKRRQALEAALQKAVKAARDEAIQPLLEHRPFQDDVVRALLDPAAPFDPQGAAQAWGENLPEHREALQNFFRKLHAALLRDDLWGPLLERFQDLRDEPAAQPLVIDRAWISQISAQLQGDGTVVQGDANTVVGAQGVLVQGDQTQVSVGDIHDISGQVNIAGGDVIAPDGDYIAPGATKAVHNYPPDPPPPPTVADPRCLEAAIPGQVVVNEDTQLLAMVRREGSKGLVALLNADDYPDLDGRDVHAKGFEVEFPVAEDGTLWSQLSWRRGGRRFLLRGRGSLEDLIRMARSIHGESR